MNEENKEQPFEEEYYETLSEVPYEDVDDSLSAVDRMNMALGGTPKERLPLQVNDSDKEELWRKFKDNEVEPEPLPKSGTPGVLPTASGYGKPGYPGGPPLVPEGIMEPVRAPLLIYVGYFSIIAVWILPWFGLLGVLNLGFAYRNRLVVLRGNEAAKASGLPALYSMRNTSIALGLSLATILFMGIRFLL